ncbi:uncharacterized protein V6R79_000812 [Siganus canaliculatus]
MTETETRNHHAGKPKQQQQQQNGGAMPESSTVEDVFDDTYKEKEGPKPPMRLVWRNIILMSLLHIGALYGLVLIPSASVPTLAWTAVCYLISALGVTAGAHRLWSHRSYKASLPLKVFLALANSMAFQNDIYEWARDHRVHHKYSETDADPHNATRGFFFSHIGWLLVRKHPDVIEKGKKLELTDLKADKVVMFQRRHYKLSVAVLCFLLPMLVPWYFWGESLAVGYFVPGLLRYTVILNATWLVNSAAHLWGNRPYDKTINPRENPMVAFSAIGEGFHNYHHTFPFDYATILTLDLIQRLCAYLIYSSSVAAGAQSGIEECKHQFAWDRWNCPERALQLSTHSSLRSANREAAFVHAISSAGVMYTLTRNCSLGDFDNCGCDDSRNGQRGGHGWLWGGCSDNVVFGEAISKQFVDALETGQDARAAMNLHNNEAGRKAVKGTMQRTCKCHGVSGSCTTQTCWLQLPEFREVGNYLKEKYHRALKVDLLRGAGNSAASRGAIAETFSSISRKELVHLEDSPDYCLENRTLGLPGTEGRECLKKGKSLSKWEKRSCKRLCGECGLAVEERKAEMVSSCNCKFHWCCAVKCEQCRKTVTKYFCVKKGGQRGRNESAGSRRKNLRLRKKH